MRKSLFLVSLAAGLSGAVLASHPVRAAVAIATPPGVSAQAGGAQIHKVDDDWRERRRREFWRRRQEWRRRHGYFHG